MNNVMDGIKDDEIYCDEESDPSEDTSNAEIEEDDTFNIGSDKEFLAFYYV